MCERCYYATRWGRLTEVERLKARNFVRDGVGVLSGPRGGVWLVDLEDFDKVCHMLWSNNGAGYAQASIPGGGGRTVYLHRLLLPDVKTVDHIDRDPRNCRRSNLRDGTGINQLNSPKRPK